MVHVVEPPLPRLIPPPPPWVRDLVAAALITAIALAPFPGGEFRASTPLTWVLVLLPAVLLPARRRWPLPTLAASTLIYCTLLFLGVVSAGAALGVGIAMFGAANRTSRRTTFIAVLAAELVVIGTSIIASLGSTFDPRTVQVALVIAFAGAVGDATKFRREYLQAMTERAIRAEETREVEARRRVSEERLRIARDLHDAVAHQISVISLNAGVASASLETRPDKTREALATIRTASRTVLSEIGGLLAMLRADDEDQPALAPQPDLSDLDRLVASFVENGLEAGVRRDSVPVAVPSAVSRVAYRVVQEGLTNALKHGSQRRAHVLIEGGAEELRVVVTNPAISPDDTNQRAGFGLIGLHERVASARGTLTSGWTPGGFRLAAELPLPDGSAS
ncbi:sensor histidine kinase [Microbacterium sp. RG1]|uniref:sensor histidine kinase n=1 Tax=Microbacterium sp. RG1 TaxID=2489212 RepID=UPI0010CA4414|nr:histidine kinase [Microbacterium sp. RG1]QCQ15710.1 sensor histidine kinase [Microbacterium sp. RG1]